MKVSDYIASFLKANGIKVVFGYQGGMVTHLIDSIGKDSELTYVQCYHEQTAAIAAEGYSRETDKIGCAISSSGPGVTNMMTGIADAYFDSIPVLYLTGQVNTYEYKYDKPIRQQGFQEMEVAELVKPITKYSKMIDRVEDIPYELEKAIYIALSDRKGPVLLDIPLNIQRGELSIEDICHFEAEQAPVSSNIDYDEIMHMILSAKHPMLLLGAGCKCGKSRLLINEFVKRAQIPIVTSLMGKDTVTDHYLYHMGMIGSYGNRCANMAISQSDLLIVLGSRLDTRQTGAKLDSFIPDAQIIHVNNDKHELISHRLENRVKVNVDVSDFIQKLLLYKYPDYSLWHTFLENLKKKYNQNIEIERFVTNKSPYRMMQMLNFYTKEGDVITADIGQNQMWAAQTIQIKTNMKFITSGGLAPMGFAMPAAIGIAFANPDKCVYTICGDGGFHMSSQALGVISQHGLNIKVILMNNKSLGMIKQFQQLYFGSRYYGTNSDSGYSTPDFKKMVEAYNIPYFSLSEADLLNTDLLKHVFSCKTCIIEYNIDGFTEVCPKLEYDRPIYQPMPLLDEEELYRSLHIKS